MVIKTASNFIVCCHGKGSKLCTMCYADALASQKSDLLAKVADMIDNRIAELETHTVDDGLRQIVQEVEKHPIGKLYLAETMERIEELKSLKKCVSEL